MSASFGPSRRVDWRIQDEESGQPPAFRILDVGRTFRQSSGDPLPGCHQTARSGAAHEINNPLGFLTSNLQNLQYCLEELRMSATLSSKALELMRANQQGEALRALEEIQYLEGESSAGDGLEMINESLEGARRVGDIVRGLRELSRQEIGRGDPCCVNSAVTRVVRSEFGEHAPHVILDLQAKIRAEIQPLHMDQALGHILRNAKQAVTGTQKVI